MDDSTKQQLLVGRERFARGEYDGAEAALREVIGKEDRFADVHDMLGIIAHTRSNYVAAEHHFERALALNPHYTEAALNLAVTYNDRGKYEAAREVYQKLRQQPAHASLDIEPFARGKIANMHAALGEAYLDVGHVIEAVAEYEKAVALCPDFVDLHTRLGAILRDHGDLARSRTHLEEAIRARPGYVPAHLHLGATLLALGDRAGAESHWKQVLVLEPENSRARMYMRTLEATEKT
jgi:tetratricopeptide (TPR) repeat protein